MAIARALVTRPSLLLADEPTGNLDSRTSVEIMALFQELNEQGSTIVLVTHEPDIAEHATRIVELRDGWCCATIAVDGHGAGPTVTSCRGGRMKANRLIGIATQSILKNKMRTLLTMLGIIIGVGAVIVMVAIGQGAQGADPAARSPASARTSSWSHPGASEQGGVNQGAGTSNRLTLRDAEAIERESVWLSAVSPMVLSPTQVDRRRRQLAHAR